MLFLHFVIFRACVCASSFNDKKNNLDSVLIVSWETNQRYKYGRLLNWLAEMSCSLFLLKLIFLNLPKSKAFFVGILVQVEAVKNCLCFVLQRPKVIIFFRQCDRTWTRFKRHTFKCWRCFVFYVVKIIINNFSIEFSELVLFFFIN